MVPDLLLQTVSGVFSVASLSHTLPSINRMGPRTHHGVRAAYLFAACGAFGILIGVFAGYVPSVAETLFVSGVGLLAFFGRREHFKCRHARTSPGYGRRLGDCSESCGRDAGVQP